MLTSCVRIFIGSRLSACLIFSLLLHLVLALLCNQKTSFVADGKNNELAGKTGTNSALLVFMSPDSLSRKKTEGVKARPFPAKAARMLTEAISVDSAVEQVEEIIGGRALQHADSIIREPRYYRLSDLTRNPHILQEPSFVLPTSEDTEVTGKVILRLFIGESGAVDRVVVEESELPESFEESIADSFTKASFIPGAIEETPVNSQVRIEVRYETLR